MKRFVLGMFVVVILAGFCVITGCDENEVKIQHEETHAPKVVEQHEVVVP